MYCVQCGVKLADGEESCPLCGTPVMSPELVSVDPHPKYSDRYPRETEHGKYALLGFLTAVAAVVCIVSLTVCLKHYGGVRWSGYVMLGVAFGWTAFILPFWFRRPNPFIFLTLDFAAACGYLLYICLYNRMSWFLSFAFPVTVLLCVLTLTGVALFMNVKKDRIFVAGGLFIATGGSCMLAELFAHITFRTPMFLWSLYCVSFFGAMGLFLIIAGMIPPLRAFLERKLFY
jgi:hypothetical protein